ncbi:unnamed protein product, partial [Owenia fusiformis]
CRGTSDVVFVIDSSGSVGEENYKFIRDFIVNIAFTLDISSNQTRVAAIIFHNEAEVIFHLNRYTNREDVISALRNLPYNAGSTATKEGLESLMSDMFQEANGDRSNVPDIAIVVTDGAAKTGNPIPAANAAKAAGVEMFAIGIKTAELNIEEVNGIASEPTDIYASVVDDFSGLSTIAETIAEKSCIQTISMSTTYSKYLTRFLS